MAATSPLWSQTPDSLAPRVLPAGVTHVNTSGASEFVLSQRAFDQMLATLERARTAQERVALLEEQVGIFRERVALADSALTLRTVESTFWYDKLQITDDELKQVRIERTRWYNSRLLWFALGAATAVVVDVSR